MTNIYSFFNTIFKIKNSKILILILIFSYTSRALSKSEHELINYSFSNHLDNTKNYLNNKNNSNIFDTQFIYYNQLLVEKFY